MVAEKVIAQCTLRWRRVSPLHPLLRLFQPSTMPPATAQRELWLFSNLVPIFANAWKIEPLCSWVFYCYCNTKLPTRRQSKPRGKRLGVADCLPKRTPLLWHKSWRTWNVGHVDRRNYFLFALCRIVVICAWWEPYSWILVERQLVQPVLAKLRRQKILLSR